jgi:hypothetical protein
MLESFAFERVLKIGDAFSTGVQSLSAILAGGKFATDALFLVLVGPMDDLVCLFSNDFALHLRGRHYATREWGRVHGCRNPSRSYGLADLSFGSRPRHASFQGGALG